MLENEELKKYIPLVKMAKSENFSMSAPAAAPDLALLGVVRSHSDGSDARREISYSVQTGGIVVRSSSTVLASLGLNTYSRGKSGEGWDSSRR